MTATEQLEQKRIELREAELNLAAAESAMNVSAVVDLQQRCVVLRRFIGDLAVKAMGESEVDAAEQAAALVERLRSEYARQHAAIEPAASAARSAIAFAQDKVGATFELYSTAARSHRGIALLCARFGLESPALPDICEAPNLLADLISVDVREKLERRPPLPPTLGFVASDTPDQRHASRVHAVAKYVARHPGSVAPEVAALFKMAPVPDLAAPEDPDRKARRDARVPRGDGMLEHAKELQRAYDAVDNAPEADASKVAKATKRRAVARARAAEQERLGEDAKRLRNPPALSGPLGAARES